MTDSTIRIMRPERPVVSTDTASAHSVQPKSAADSLLPISPNAVEQTIHYSAADSIALTISDRNATLHREGVILYDDMELQADRIAVDFERQTLSAHGMADSTGNPEGRPRFKQGQDEYFADTLVFNYSTKKGMISGVITQEGDGYLHGNKVKKVNDSVMYLNSGQYTTCNYAHPHFAINFTKSKLITGKMIFSGPAYVTVEDVPTPLALPFAFFPLIKGRTSGLLMPSYGWMNGRGYYLKDIGYYFAINDYMDLALTADLYTNLSWKGEAKTNYYRRYHYRGNLDVQYGRYRQGLKGDTANFNIFNDFKVSWQHSQDAKANPRSRFSANVNLQSANYNKTTTNSADFFNSTTTSSISYSTSIGSFLNLSAAMNESYNTQTHLVNLRLPTISLSSTTFYPLRRKASTSLRWYENISMSYVLNAANNLNVADSLLLQRSTLHALQYGVQHQIPLQSSVRVLRYFNWTNSLSYTERWHWNTIRKSIDPTTQYVTVDTVQGFRTNRDVSFSSSLSTRFYGMFLFRLPHLQALRHVVNPSVNFRFAPDFGNSRFGYWQSYTDSSGYVHRYSIFERSLYGGPADGRSGRLGFSISNNLEAKIKPFSRADSTAEVKKVTLIENLTLSMNYDFAKDSLNWSDLNITGHTTLFRSLVLNYTGVFSPYLIDSAGRKHNQLLWQEHQKPFQRTNATYGAQLSWNINPSTFRNDNNTQRPARSSTPHPSATNYLYEDAAFALPTLPYADFDMPWNVSLSYSYNRVSTYVAAKYNFSSTVVQSISLSGSLTLTPAWRISFSTGYDIANKGLSYTSIDIYRDLHCWEMRFNWIPFGYYKSWNFVVNIKAPSLRDVKYQKRKPYQDNDSYSLY